MYVAVALAGEAVAHVCTAWWQYHVCMPHGGCNMYVPPHVGSDRGEATSGWLAKL